MENLPVMKASAESLGWRGICQATGNLPVTRASAESLGWRGKCQAMENLSVMKASAESLGTKENVRRRVICDEGLRRVSIGVKSAWRRGICL